MSSVVVLEAALKAFEQVLGARSAPIKAAQRRAENLLSALSSSERRQVCLPEPDYAGVLVLSLTVQVNALAAVLALAAGTCCNADIPDDVTHHAGCGSAQPARCAISGGRGL